MPTKDLTRLQAEMDALAGVKCPNMECPIGMDSDDFRYFALKSAEDELDGIEYLSCPCNGTGLDPKYDCLRVECTNQAHTHVGVQPCNVEGCAEHRESCPNYITLPADRAHEAVGKLLAATHRDLEHQGEGWPGEW